MLVAAAKHRLSLHTRLRKLRVYRPRGNRCCTLFKGNSQYGTALDDDIPPVPPMPPRPVHIQGMLGRHETGYYQQESTETEGNSSLFSI